MRLISEIEQNLIGGGDYDSYAATANSNGPGGNGWDGSSAMDAMGGMSFGPEPDPGKGSVGKEILKDIGVGVAVDLIIGGAKEVYQSAKELFTPNNRQSGLTDAEKNAIWGANGKYGGV